MLPFNELVQKYCSNLKYQNQKPKSNTFNLISLFSRFTLNF